MRLLFELDLKNYDPNGTIGKRPSVRGIIIKNNKIALVHSMKYDYYKFPGGGIHNGESHLETLSREVSEESGLHIIADSVKEYGYVLRKEKGDRDDIFLQENFYYLVEAIDKVFSQNLDDYEDEEKFTLEWVDPMMAIRTNERPHEGLSMWYIQMLKREAMVLHMLISEGYFQIPEEIYGNRIIIRHARPSDLEAIYENIWSDKELASHMFWPPQESIDGAEDRLTRTIAFQKGKPMYFLADRITDEAIGMCGIKEESPGIWSEAGICVAKKYQQKGIGKELLKLLVEECFYRYQAKVFAYYLMKGNEPSLRLAQAFGFHYDSEAIEVRGYDQKEFMIQRYLLTKEEYEENIR